MAGSFELVRGGLFCGFDRVPGEERGLFAADRPIGGHGAVACIEARRPGIFPDALIPADARIARRIAQGKRAEQHLRELIARQRIRRTERAVAVAEQDPAIANPLEYAIKARKYIAEKAGL